MTTWRYIAQRALTNEWLDWEVPISRDELTWALSGAGSFRGTVSPEYTRLARAADGRPVLEEWGTYLYAEADGILRWGGIVQSVKYRGGAMAVEAAGFVSYANGLPTLSEISGVNLDPAAIFKEIWEQGVQGQPDGNLDMTVDSLTTPQRMGTPEEPYEFVWWNAPDAGQEMATLTQVGKFDFIEEHTWSGDDATHRLRLHYPRAGRKRTDLAFVQGDNIASLVEPERDGSVFANEVIGLGAGEGRSRVLHRVPQRDGKLRRPYVYSDVSVTSASTMDARVRPVLASRRNVLEIPGITVRNHPNAHIGSWQLGDDILIQADIPWLGPIDLWHRVVAWSLVGEDLAQITLKRSDSFTYGG